MGEEEGMEEGVAKLKRPAVSSPVYSEIKALADENLAISAADVGWEKCLEIVIDEYVPGQERKRSARTKGEHDMYD